MTQHPQSFLQSQSQPWSRSIEQRLADLERQDQLIAQETGNNFAQINSSITSLATRIVQLGTTTTQLGTTITQLNNAAESKSASQLYTSASTPFNSQTARTDFDAALVSFTRPSWATGATVIAVATFAGSDSVTSGYNATFRCRINNVNNSAGGTVVTVPNVLEVRDAGVVTSLQAFATTPAPTVIVFTQTFTTNAASIAASCRITKALSGAASTFNVSVASTIFWNAA